MATPEPELEATAAFTLNSHATALCFIPDEASWPPIDSLRSLYDKAYRKWPPHVNLIYPFVQPDSLDAASQRIQSFLKSGCFDTIDIDLNTAGVFSHRHEKTLFLHDGRSDGSAEPIRQLRAGLLAALKGRSGAVNSDGDDTESFRMHMTVAQSSSAATSTLPLPVTEDGADATSTPKDTFGHAHRFLLHKVENLPHVAWPAARLHILVRELLTMTRDNRSDGEAVATTTRMRLWGVLHLSDGRIEKLDRPVPFYDELPFENDKRAGEVDDGTEDERMTGERAGLPTFQAVTFVPGEDEWARCSDDHGLYASLSPISPCSLSIATYNVLAEFEWPPRQDRFSLLIDNILASNAAADVIVLQEVTDHFLAVLLADNGVRNAYPFASHGPPDQDDMEPLPSLLNMVVLSRRPFSWSWLDFHRVHKGALIARFDRQEEEDDEDDKDDNEDGDGQKYRLVLATVHLTHGLTDGSVLAKRTELQRLLSHLQQQYPPSRADAVVLAGDFNIHSSSSAIEAAIRRKGISTQSAQYVETGFDNLLAHHGFADAYHATRGVDDEEYNDTTDEVMHTRRHDSSNIVMYDDEDGATYNPFTNALAARIIGSGLNTRPERFDRILVRGARTGHKDDADADHGAQRLYSITHYNTFGFPSRHEDHSSPDSYASDHWGIRCTIKRITNDNDDSDDGSATNANSRALAGDANSLGISAEVEKLIVHVQPIRAPAGPLAEDIAVDTALRELNVLPSEDEISRRKAAFGRLKAILLDQTEGTEPSTTSKDPRQLVVVPVGSYGLDVWTPASDIDCLCIGTFGPQTFFVMASQRLRAAAAASGDTPQSVRIIRRVRAHTGTMLELEINGIRMDLQYCGAAVIAETWPAVLVLPTTHPVFSISPQTLHKLKAARDLYYLRKSFPDSTAAESSKHLSSICTASNFRTAHRAIKTWACSRGLYSARFGYLGGIQIAILLARVMKLMQREIDKANTNAGFSNDAAPYTVADILVTLFQHYADFDWKTDLAFDPFFHSEKRPYSPTSREPLAIIGYHRPQLNTSMAASVPSVRVLAEEFQRAAGLLRDKTNGLTWSRFLSGGGTGGVEACGTSLAVPYLAPGPAEFVRAYRSYVKLDLHYWGLSLARGSAFVGWLESRCVLLLVDLARRLPDLNARFWPGRFVDVGDHGEEKSGTAASEDNNGDETRQYQGCYLIGLDLPATMTREERRVALGTLQSVLAHFEKQIRRGGDGHANTDNFDPQWQWIGVSVASRADLGDVGRLRLDSRAWGEYTPGDEESDKDDGEDDGQDDDGASSAGEGAKGAPGGSMDNDGEAEKKAKGRGKDKKKLPMAVVHRPGGGVKFRTAQDVIKRLRWDPHLDRSDFIVGYEDRFLGARERPLELWKSEQTDEEFIPQHRILYFRRRSDGITVWDRRARKDDIFGSGV